jgi:hypothetical protein
MRDPVEAHFRVSGVLKLQSRPGVYVCGEIVDGEVKRGMEIAWPIHGDAITTSVPIREVEFIDYAPGVAGIALGVRFAEDEAENEQFLRDFLEVGMVVSVAAASDQSPSAAG